MYLSDIPALSLLIHLPERCVRLAPSNVHTTYTKAEIYYISIVATTDDYTEVFFKYLHIALN